MVNIDEIKMIFEILNVLLFNLKLKYKSKKLRFKGSEIVEYY